MVVVLVALVSVAAAGGCATTDADPASAIARTDVPLTVAYTPGRPVRAVRTVHTVAQGRRAGRPIDPAHGFEGRAEMGFRLTTRAADAPARFETEVSIAHFVSDSVQSGNAERFDSRDPDGIEKLRKSAARKPAARTALRALETPQRVEHGEDIQSDLKSFPSVPGLRLPLRWVCGGLPFGPLEGTATPGHAWTVRGVLGGGMAGLRYDDPLLFGVRWTVESWDAPTRTAVLRATGTGEVDDTRLRTARVTSLHIDGRAVWDAARRLVVRSSMEFRAELVNRESDAWRVDWTATFGETLADDSD